MPTSGSRGAVQFWCFCCRVSCLLDSSSIWLQVLGQHSQHRGLLGGQKMFVVVVVVASVERKIETPASFSWLTISASMWMSYLQSLGKRLIQSMTRMDKPKFLVDRKKGRKKLHHSFFLLPSVQEMCLNVRTQQVPRLRHLDSQTRHQRCHQMLKMSTSLWRRRELVKKFVFDILRLSENGYAIGRSGYVVVVDGRYLSRPVA